MERRNQKIRTWKRILRFAPIATVALGLPVSVSDSVYAWDEEPQILSLPPAVTISSPDEGCETGGAPQTAISAPATSDANLPAWLQHYSGVKSRNPENVLALFGITLHRSQVLASANSPTALTLPPLPGLKFDAPVVPKSVESAPTLVTLPTLAIGVPEPNKFPDLPSVSDNAVTSKLTDAESELPVRIVQRGVRVAEAISQEDQQSTEFRLSDRTNIQLASSTDDVNSEAAVVESAQLEANLTPPVLPSIATLPKPELALGIPPQTEALASAQPLQLPPASFTINVTPEPVESKEAWSMRTHQDVQTPIEASPAAKPDTIVMSIPSQAEPLPTEDQQPERMEMTLALPKISFPAQAPVPETPKALPVNTAANTAAETLSTLIAKEKAVAPQPLPSLRPEAKPATTESDASKTKTESGTLALNSAEPSSKEASLLVASEPSKALPVLEPVSTSNTNLQVRKDEIREVEIRGEVINADIEGGICSIVPTGKSKFAVVPLQTGSGVVQIDFRNQVGEVHRVRLALQVETATASASSMPTALANLEKTLAEKYPGCNIRLQQGDEKLIVSGTVPTEEDAKKILLMVRKLCLVPVQDRVSVR